MKSYRFAIMLGLLIMVLSACVTETKGRIKTVEKPGEAAELNVQMGSQYLRNGDWTSARVKLERAVEQEPNNVIAHRLLGFVYESLGDLKGAEQHYRHAVSLDPRDPYTLDALAVFLCRDEKKLDEALKLFDRAVSIPLSKTFSNKAVLYTNAGVCMKRLDLARSEDYLRAALAADPQFAEALLQVADVSYQRDNYLQSRAFLQRHLAIAAPSPTALWLAVRVEKSMGDFKAADKFGNQLRVTFPESVETRQLLEQIRDAG
ncbi:MAG: type IV pilus biogenesis/stability protein PilW [Gammaproteobacteria bacterium]|nr:type IV pilus biogenesis/stability protein PilW [Chromatiales bacterium]MDP6674369.1 type IV pilus biogenesis/stability protein PilW [Gammaproteobacteria bacterium]